MLCSLLFACRVRKRHPWNEKREELYVLYMLIILFDACPDFKSFIDESKERREERKKKKNGYTLCVF